MNWHTLSSLESLELLESSGKGLSSLEAESRKEKYGRNVIEEKKKNPPWVLFLKQFTDFMILVLLAAALISGLVGELKDSVVILVIVFLNAVVGFIQEYRAEKAVEALKKISAPGCNALRDGELKTIQANDLVPGDIVNLETGNLVPADIRLLESFSLKIQEASLTGESNPIEKDVHVPEKTGRDEIPIGDRKNMAFRGTLVTYGRGSGVVVETGMNTQIGSIARMLQEEEVATPLQLRLMDLGKKLSISILGICLALFVVGLFRGAETIPMFMTSISLAVAAIPEALPAVLTISLALGASRMVRVNAIIRKLPAVETLGSITFICSDKTGTITQNRMNVKEIYLPGNTDPLVQSEEKSELLLAMGLNHDAVLTLDGSWKGDPTEIAVADYSLKNGAPQEELLKRLAEVPFDSDRKRMTTVHRVNGRIIAFVKGGVESVLSNCRNENRNEIESVAIRMAKQGMRVLAYSFKVLNEIPEKPSSDELENNLTFLGLVALMDPPRPEAFTSVAECKKAGIIPVMITGDHPETARTVATEVGILRSPEDMLLTGNELSLLSEKDYIEQVKKVKVYARVSPEQKLHIVKTLQNQGEFVAMTGDGVNDAPALKRANIGIAMGITGTDVSKEAAHMILRDDNFATIIKAVKEGRRIFDNLRKFIRFALIGNTGELMAIIIAPLLGMPIPLAPIHILWINLVTDGLPGLALAAEKEENNIMSRPPRKPEESIFAGGMVLDIILIGMLIGGICLGIQKYSLLNNIEGWQTMVFTVLCLSQTFVTIAIRSETDPAYRSGFSGNPFLIGTILLNATLQLLLLYIPLFREIFNLQKISDSQILLCFLLSLVPGIVLEIIKKMRSIRNTTSN